MYTADISPGPQETDVSAANRKDMSVTVKSQASSDPAVRGLECGEDHGPLDDIVMRGCS